MDLYIKQNKTLYLLSRPPTSTLESVEHQILLIQSSTLSLQPPAFRSEWQSCETILPVRFEWKRLAALQGNHISQASQQRHESELITVQCAFRLDESEGKPIPPPFNHLVSSTSLRLIMSLPERFLFRINSNQPKKPNELRMNQICIHCMPEQIFLLSFSPFAHKDFFLPLSSPERKQLESF